MSSLEEFFSDDTDVPPHYICSLTETIFIEPALLNGRIYERSKILEWIKTNKTDPFTREQISAPSRSLGIESMVHPIMKSSLGLDVFMKYKVEQFFKKLQVLNKAYHSSLDMNTTSITTSATSTAASTKIGSEMANTTDQHPQDYSFMMEKDSIRTEIISHVFKLMIRFISSCFLYINNHHGGNNVATPLPDHYHIAKNELPKYVTLFDKQELLETCLEECKHSQHAFNIISEFINESFARNSPTTNDSSSPAISTRMNQSLSKPSSQISQNNNSNGNNHSHTSNGNNNSISELASSEMKKKNLVSLMDAVNLSPNSSPTLIQQALTHSSPLIAVMNTNPVNSLLKDSSSPTLSTNNIWITIPPIETGVNSHHYTPMDPNIISSLFSDEIFSHIPNTDQVMNLSSLRYLSHYLYKTNQTLHSNQLIKEYTDSHVKYTVLKQGIAMKKDVKSFFQNSKLKKRHILLVSSKSKFKVFIFNADGNNNEVFHSDMKPSEEMELSNLCYITINDQPKKNVSIFSSNTLTLNDRTEKKKWLFEFENSYERDEWFYMLKYCLLLC
ncbi:hypothetical protein C9374_000542 [Naegleria lovaniensis]|uniref:PH domain-containing protein n=1 Tax=Naegleria lovaniensis TaxID=51637 RepID=A0AA88GZ95_NAELO|nr:uncharacterized protein C9374_000542 [Naegleria lovaniensis]KAG2388378.1 hypothetical protein C9374_000542 [Naegleria lovaniensis]